MPQVEDLSLPLADLPPGILMTLSRAEWVEDFVVTATQAFQKVAGKAESLAAEDIKEQNIIKIAKARAARLGQLLEDDLDGDGKIEEGEVARSAAQGRKSNPENIEQRVQQAIREVMSADTDGDHVLSWAEIMAAANTYAEQVGNMRQAGSIADVMAFDADSDGNLTVSEVRQSAQDLFALADKDGDKRLSEVERKILHEYAQMLAQLQQEDAALAGCTFDRPQPGQKIAIVHARRGLSIPRVSLVGSGATTWSAAIAVEPGPEPFWILAMADEPMLWHMEGADERVAKLVVLPGESERVPAGFGLPADVQPDKPAAGVTGLSPEKIQFVDPAKCQLTRVLKNHVKDAQSTISHIFGRKADALALNVEMFAMILPDSRLTAIPPSASDKKPWDLIPLDPWQIGEGFGTIPVVKVDAADVIATGKVDTYDVLPGENGIVELAQSGAIVPRPVNSFQDANGAKIKMMTRYRGHIFEIVKAIPHFPADLPDRNGVTYVLGAGVPMPSGMPRRSCVLDGATGKPLNDSRICVRVK